MAGERGSGGSQQVWKADLWRCFQVYKVKAERGGAAAPHPHPPRPECQCEGKERTRSGSGLTGRPLRLSASRSHRVPFAPGLAALRCARRGEHATATAWTAGERADPPKEYHMVKRKRPQRAFLGCNGVWTAKNVPTRKKWLQRQNAADGEGRARCSIAGMLFAEQKSRQQCAGCPLDPFPACGVV